MTQAQWITTLLEYGSVGAVTAILQWIAVYTWLQPWWKSHIGRSLILLAGFSMVTPVLFILSLFLHLNRGDSNVLAWIEIALLFAYVPAMAWRSVIWVRSARGEEHGLLPAGEKDEN